MFGLTACEKVSEQAPSHTQNKLEKHVFWADLFIMPESELSEFEKPSDQKLKISTLSEVTIGDRVALKLLFSAMELQANSMADVTFDTEMIRPDGTKSETATHSDLPARVGKIGAPLNVHNSDAVLILTFDPEDLRGTYTINVVARDNIGGSEIAITKEFELIE